MLVNTKNDMEFFKLLKILLTGIGSSFNVSLKIVCSTLVASTGTSETEMLSVISSILISIVSTVPTSN